jgi:hypothetical protein
MPILQHSPGRDAAILHAPDHPARRRRGGAGEEYVAANARGNGGVPIARPPAAARVSHMARIPQLR